MALLPPILWTASSAADRVAARVDVFEAGGLLALTHVVGGAGEYGAYVGAHVCA